MSDQELYNDVIFEVNSLQAEFNDALNRKCASCMIEILNRMVNQRYRIDHLDLGLSRKIDKIIDQARNVHRSVMRRNDFH